MVLIVLSLLTTFAANTLNIFHMSPAKAGIALLFDMDGVVVDNHKFHQEAWIRFCDRYGIVLTSEEFSTKMFGGNNKTLLERVFGRHLPDTDIQRYASEKELLYRELHLPHIQPLAGLKEFLVSARQQYISTAIATAAPRENLEFVLHHTGLKPFFDVTLDESDVFHGKPDPEIYLKAASYLGYAPSHCIVFEDSLTGVSAAMSAGMRVVGVTTSIDATLLHHTWKQIQDFTQITVKSLIHEQNY